MLFHFIISCDVLSGWVQANIVVHAEMPGTSRRRAATEQWLVDYKPPLTRATRRREEIVVTEGHVKREGLGVD